jgi:histidinol dehydrogenase
MPPRVYRSDDYESLEHLRSSIPWDFWAEDEPIEEVRAIISEVRQRGDAALVDFTKRFDGVDLSSSGMRVTPEEVARASESIESDFKDAVRIATRAITAFHRRQTWESQFWESEEGARIGQIVRPLSRVGVYIPGGVAAYPSTAMMTVIPAKVAGVSEIMACVPPGSGGEINPHVLYTLNYLGVEEIYRIGGAQAIAAMAVGTESISPVDKIVGPGNIYVALAKKEVYGIVGIDMLAGPSELVVIAEEQADPGAIALDIAAQLEHGSGARACLITPFQSVIDSVAAKLKGCRAGHEEGEFFAVQVKDMDEGLRLVDLMAPEHLLIIAEDVTGITSKVHNAGTVFLGVDTPAALGDYVVGVNHVLPTGGAARFSSPLGVYDFIKRSNFVLSNPRANRTLGPVIEVLAQVEGFLNHANSVRRRTHQ